MQLEAPSESELRAIAEQFAFDLTDDDVASYGGDIEALIDSCEVLQQYDPGGPDVSYPGPRTHTRAKDGRFNAWITRCRVEGATEGPLAGRTVGLKDNIALAQVPMTCGSDVLEGYVPEIDATVVTRLLDAGATVVGKTNMDDMAFSGVGDTSAFGPTRNPADPTRLAGGSSGGSAAAVAAGDVDVALGTDQGGSIRAPAAWTGVVGYKPTHGLVPYTGCVGLARTVDHVGPLARSVEDIARTLEIIAGPDGFDARQPRRAPAGEYTESLETPVEDLSIAVVEEGFANLSQSNLVTRSVSRSMAQLEAAGARVERVSVPMHEDAIDIFTISLAGGIAATLRGEGIGHHWPGWWNTDRISEFSRLRRVRAHLLPREYKTLILFGAYLSQHYPAVHATAMNLRRRLRDRYNAVLEDNDVLAMPTTPGVAVEYDPDTNRAPVDDSYTPLSNTCAFNATGHPSISVPIQTNDTLPVGLMLSGSRFDDTAVLQAGRAVEVSTGTDN